METVRLDRWLCAARIFQSRTQATDACGGGHVRLNGAAVRASHLVRIGDSISALAPRGQVVLEVLALGEKRLSASDARALFADHSPPPPPREARLGARDRGAGRPTKADRRALERLREG